MSDQERGYQGWANYETWLVKLWIDNDQGTQEYWMERAKETRELGGVFALSGELKESFEDANPLGEDASIWTDLLDSALSEVDWQEIAEDLLASE